VFICGQYPSVEAAQKYHQVKENGPRMNTDEHGFPDPLAGRVLGAVLEVSNTLGTGFLEKVYERALLLELRLRAIGAVAQASFPVMYKGRCVGEYFADLLVENTLLIELKCVERRIVHSPGCASEGGIR
jgi:GxxExxY protein